MPRTKASLPLALLALCLLAGPAVAWHAEGHRRVGEDAVRMLPREVPGFFREGAATVGHGAIDPDVWKLDELAELDEAESPQHYLDVELLRDREWPEDRSGVERLYRELGLGGRQAGFLPWAIVEGAQRLAVGFAQHRRWPRDEAIRAKCLVWAGWLAHYTGDLGQPLHTTIHHNGRALPDGSSPRTGMHHRIDGLLGRTRFDRRALLRGVHLRPVDDLLEFVAARFAESHALVDATYDLLPAIERGMDDPEVLAFTRERHRASARQTAELFLWAWRRSESIELPKWLER